MADNRPVRICVACLQKDTAPRDVVGLPDGNNAYYHMDCHVAVANCPVCYMILETAGGFGNHLQNDALVDHITDPEVTSAHEIFTHEDALGYAEAEVAKKGGI